MQPGTDRQTDRRGHLPSGHGLSSGTRERQKARTTTRKTRGGGRPPANDTEETHRAGLVDLAHTGTFYVPRWMGSCPRLGPEPGMGQPPTAAHASTLTVTRTRSQSDAHPEIYADTRAQTHGHAERQTHPVTHTHNHTSSHTDAHAKQQEDVREATAGPPACRSHLIVVSRALGPHRRRFGVLGRLPRPTQGSTCSAAQDQDQARAHLGKQVVMLLP